MVGTASSSSLSSNASLGSFDDVSVKPAAGDTVKLLCSYGGKILPRYPDGKLRYVGGDTRVLAVDRSVTFAELQMKLKELCGWEAFTLRCPLPSEDLNDTLVTVASDEDLANLFEEYDLGGGGGRDRLAPLKIRAFLSSPQSRSPRAPIPLAPTFKTRGDSSDRCAVLQIRRPAARFHGHHSNSSPLHHHHRR